MIKDIRQINIQTEEGKLLLAAMSVLLTSEPYQKSNPNVLLGILQQIVLKGEEVNKDLLN